MRKIYAALLSLFFLLVWNSETRAQVSAYSFSQSSGTYTENTDAGRVILGTTANDDQVFNNSTTGGTPPITNTGFPIGFNFTYNEVVYDKFAVNNNGWIVLGTGSFQAAASSGNYTPLSTAGPAGLVSVIAGLARDLQGQAGSELSYQTLGSAPNRKLVVQWKGYRRWNGTGQNYNFQIILNESTNAVVVAYGAFTESSATSGDPQVGLRGFTNTEFNNRTGLWASSTAGGANNSAMTLSTTAGGTPASGLIYTWTPPDPCSGAPTPGTTQSSLASACTGVPFTLSVTGATAGVWGLTYQWESSPNGTTWTNIAGATGSTYVATQSVATYYRRKITCSGLDSWSTSLQVGVSLATLPLLQDFATFTTTGSAPPVCWLRNNATYLVGNAVSAFGVGTGSAKFDFWSASSGTNLDLETPQFAPATGYYLSFDHAYATNTTQNDRLEIWTSTDGGANYALLTTYNGGTNGPLNTGGIGGLFTPTAAQWAGKVIALPATTNRIRLRGVSAFGNNLYLDNIRITACAPPTGLSATAITTTTATINWTASASSPSGGYQWEVRTSGAGGSGATGLTASGSTAAGVVTANVTGLTSNTAYNIYVRSNCGSEFSAWAGPFAFRTECDPFSLPFSQDFATYATTFPPQCWTRNNTTQLIGDAASGFGVGSGSAKFDFWNTSNGTQLDLVTPTLVATPAGYWLTFDHAYATFGTENDRLEIWTSTDNGANFTLLTTYNGGAAGPLNTAGGGVGSAFTPTAAQWGSKAIVLPTGTNKIRLRGVSAFGNNLYLDNIRVTSCVAPTGITSSAIAQTTATISWTASVSSPSGGYQWEVRSSGAPGSGATGLGASGSTAAGVLTANVTGLTANTLYSVYVRSDCGGEFSAWAGPHTFRTDCNPVALPIFENFATYSTTFPPTCWTRNNTTFLVGAASSGYGIGTGSARFNFWAAPTGTFELRTPQFTATPAGYWLMFDHAYATFSGEVDRLEILYSTDGGNSYSALTTYLGGASGPLNTGGVTGNPFASFVPSASQWASKAIAIPAGTNRLIFRGVSAFGDDLFLDNIRITSCLPPTGVTSSAETQTTATISWTASASIPSGGYQWEVRTSGAAGSGATGLAASGTTAAGVTTANVTGLTAGTAYSVYVRSDCGGSDYSTWTNAYTLTTLCNPITSFPFTETFENASATRICWRNQQLSGSFRWTYGAGSGNGGPVTTAHGGSVNAQFFGSFYGGEQALLVSPELNLTGNAAMVANGADLEFWVANPSWLGDINPLRVLYKTSAGGTWNPLPGGVFSSAINSWTKIEIPNLPNISGTYYIAFEGTQLWGWGIAIDDVVIKAGPSCRKPTNVSAIGITPTSIEVNFTSPGTDFIVEYGAVGFTPGTGATPGVGGTIVTGTASPIIIPSLTASTTYDVYVRRVCIPGADYSENVKATATTQCTATNIPYLQTFESASVPSMPTCTSIQDVNGNSGSFWFGTGGGGWETYTDNNPLSWVSPNKSLLYYYDFNDLTRGGNDWFFTQGLNLTAGTTYRLKFFYKGLDGANFPERLEVKYGMGASASNMTNNLFNNANITSVYGGAFDSVRVDFTPTSTGVYYVGFHSYSLGDMFGMLLDDISVKVAPVVDVGISNITLPNLTCPVNNVFIQAEVKNYNITPVNFANTPVNINARIVLNGTTTTNLPATVLNSGILNPNQTMGVYLGTAYNFVAGTHDITLYTTSPQDPEVLNDTLKRSVMVNPNPPTPVITPSAPQICLGNSVQLTVPTPAPATASLTQTTGPISVAVPDGSATGATSTIAVTGLPSTATITGITVTLNMTHTWINDMTIGLRAPNGKILNLFNRRGAAAAQNLVNTVISSASTTSLATGAAPFTGTFAADAAIGQGPTGLTSDATGFADLYPGSGSGNWTLVLRDHVGFDAGTLTNWTISFNYSYVPALTWTPVTELFTNAAATTPYVAGTNSYTVYAKPSTTRTYTATSTGAGGCTSTGTVTVTVNPNPVVTIGSIPDTVCISDQSIALVGNPVGGTWSGIGVSGNNFLPPTTAVGNYLLTYNYVNAFGCPGSATKRIWVKDCPERIVLLRDNAIVLFPNPTDGGRFNIRINSVLYNNLTMRVYTNSGAIVRTQKFTGLVYGRVVPIDLSALPGGVYVVEFAHENAGPRTAEKSFKVIIGH